MTATKPSGLGWAGDIPAHWDVAKICMVARLESGHTPSRQHPEYWVPEECTIPWFSLADVWQLREGKQEYLAETNEKISPRGLANSAARLLPAGTVVLSRTASVGFAGIMPRPMATTQDFANWVCGSRLQPEYLLYALRAMEDEFRRATMGSTHQTIYMPDIRRLAIPVPPMPEQQRIVGLIREKLSPLDQLLAKKERLLELLVEERQAIITEAVTRGVRRDVRMVDSGVTWLGKLPVGWRVLPFRRLLTRVEQGWSPECEDRPAEEGEWAVLKLSALSRGRFRPHEHKVLPRDVTPETRYEVRRGDLLLTRANTPLLVGDACYVEATPPRLLLPDLIYRLAIRHDLASPKFIARFLLSAPGRAQIMADARGSSMSMAKVSGSQIRSWLIPLPSSLEEQDSIVHALDARCDRIDALTDRLREHVQKLREYRQAVIRAGVTGRLFFTEKRAA